MKTLDVSGSEFLDIAESPTYSRLSFGGASVSFRVPVARFSACPYQEGEIVKVVWRGKTLLIGPVINPEHSLDGTAESWEIKIFDYWWNLANIQYFASGRSRGIFAAYKYGGGASEAKKQAVAEMEDALKSILNHAIKTALIPITYDIRIDEGAELIPFAYSSATYASLLLQIQKFRPNMAAWFEYGPLDDSITLVIADHASLPDVVLDLSAVDVSTLSLKARPDLVPPAVGLTCNATLNSAVQRAVAVYPKDATLSQPYVVTAEIDVPENIEVEDATGQGAPIETGNLGYDAPYITVRGDKFPTTSAQWVERFKRWFPALADCSNLEIAGAPKITTLTPADMEHGGYMRSATTHELVEGQINGKAGGIYWSKIKIDARLRATDPPATVKQYFPEHAGRVGEKDRWIGLLPVEVTTTNVSHARYRMDSNGTVEYMDEGSGPIEQERPDSDRYDVAGMYAGFVKSFYEATRIMPYDGSVTVHDDFDHVCGGRLSITGGLKEWETMRSVIQEVSLDLKTGVSDVTVGAPEQLSLQDSIDKSKQLAEAMQDTALASTRSASGDGTTGGVISGGIGGSTGAAPDRKRPELPSVGPSVKLLQAQEPPALGTSAAEVGYQCRLSYGENGQVEKAYIRQGRAIYAGNYIGGMLPGDNASGGWVQSPTTSGEVWLKITLDKDAKFLGSYLYATGGITDPVQLGEEDRKTPFEYWFHLATINGNKVVQHQVGAVYLQCDPGTFGPQGKA